MNCTRVPYPLTQLPTTQFTAEIQFPVLWPISGLGLFNLLKITGVINFCKQKLKIISRTRVQNLKKFIRENKIVMLRERWNRDACIVRKGSRVKVFEYNVIPVILKFYENLQMEKSLLSIPYRKDLSIISTGKTFTNYFNL